MSNVQTYVITRPGPKHFRWEDQHGQPITKTVHRPKNKLGIGLDGKTAMIEGDYFEPLPGITLVGYGAGPGLKSQIKCTPEQAAKLEHMKLVPLVQYNAQKEIEAAAKKAAAAPVTTGADDTSTETVVVPKDWHTLSASERKELASKIAGEPVERARDADAIIEAHLKG